MGSRADGLITISRPREELQEVTSAFRGEAGNKKPIYLKVQLSYARDEEEALTGAWEQWKTNIFDSNVQANLRLPEDFESAAKYVNKEQMYGQVLISSNPEKHVKWLSEFIEMGIEHLYLHNVNLLQEEFIDDFGSKVLPYLAGKENYQ